VAALITAQAGAQGGRSPNRAADNSRLKPLRSSCDDVIARRGLGRLTTDCGSAIATSHRHRDAFRSTSTLDVRVRRRKGARPWECCEIGWRSICDCGG
jgi:hypothetical protein